MAKQAIEPILDPFSPIASKADWDESGWAREPEPLTASPRLGATISITLDPDSASLIRRAARLSGMTEAEFVQRVAFSAAADALEADGR